MITNVRVEYYLRGEDLAPEGALFTSYQQTRVLREILLRLRRLQPELVGPTLENGPRVQEEEYVS